ncbi:hypothetical protein [Streptomyces sp. NPDC102437]|uniref:hypothetical protein n=1 Tax=Streptomyces sp. NPDC102437 TaxID=3366175 RepID=UPI00381FFB4A
MEREAQAAGATFADIYHQTGTHTARDGYQRGIGAMLEPSEATALGLRPPWFVHPNRTGRDLHVLVVAETIKDATTT